MDTQQLDLWIDGRNFVQGPAKDDRELMSYPFFSPSKAVRKTPIVYHSETVKITITGEKHGIATLWDKEILVYLQSLVVDQINNGAIDPKLASSRRIQFKMHAMLKWCNRTTSADGYKRAMDALRRLRHTDITTNISSGVAGKSARELTFNLR